MLSGLKTLNGQLEFYNVDEGEVLAAAEHFMATDVSWDPTGRYVATAVTSIHQMENGFNIWSWNGKLLYQCVGVGGGGRVCWGARGEGAVVPVHGGRAAGAAQVGGCVGRSAAVPVKGAPVEGAACVAYVCDGRGYD